ncbi:acyltransferase [Halobacteriovorax sp. GFR7]|uniref:acyltransferase n=1 Tax=unclassified Halobacteriovorax TaxID=2639665 RepID=UPI003D95103E
MNKISQKVFNVITYNLNQILFWVRNPHRLKMKCNGYKNVRIPFWMGIGKDTEIRIFNKQKNHISVSFGKGCWVGKRVSLTTTGNQKISLGDNSSIQDGTHLIGDIEIGSNVLFAPNVFASSGTHIFKEEPMMPIKHQDAKYSHIKDKYNKKIKIGDDVWIGTGTYISQGVTIETGVIIGANSVITKDIPSYSIVVGNNKIIGNRKDM